ncbi:MAG: DUF4404 family protein [Pseudomonadales bacterium]|nr:DUF4404 family protein [Pseudomonadales bacterium]
MSQNKLKLLLSQLHEELGKSRTIDAETLAMVRKLDRDIDELLDVSTDQYSPVMEDAIALEARFATHHPVAERLLRELIDTLGRIGI